MTYRSTTPNAIVTLDLVLADPEATAQCGRAIAPMIEGGMVITLSGALGSGKTTLVRALLRARGVTGLVRSPSFTLVEHYPVSSLYFYHIDLYRFAHPSEWETSGLAECFRDDAVCLIEWPERAEGRLPAPDLEIFLSYPERGTGRRLRVVATSGAGERCECALRAAMTAHS